MLLSTGVPPQLVYLTLQEIEPTFQTTEAQVDTAIETSAAARPHAMPSPLPPCAETTSAKMPHGKAGSKTPTPETWPKPARPASFGAVPRPIRA